MASSSDRKRERAEADLAGLAPEEVIPPAARLLVGTDDPAVREACWEVLASRGAAVGLAGCGADGWLESLGERIGSFSSICEVMGERFLGYAMILGLKIGSLTLDPKYPGNTTVEFSSAEDDSPQTLTLAEFRSEVVQVLAEPKRPARPVAMPLTADAALDLLGRRLYLLLPLFGISIGRMAVSSADPADQGAILEHTSGGETSVAPLSEVEREMRLRLLRDLAGTREEPLRIDLAAVHRARAAAERGDPDAVIAALETWPGLLVTLQRTPVFRELEPEQVALIAEGLELLGAAFGDRGRATWSEELYRLGLQFARDGAPAARLYWRLGQTLVEAGRCGEAIGMLRRALSLGIPEALALPTLGRAFLRRGKVVPATAVLEGAASAGAGSAELEADLAEARGIIERAGLSWDVPQPDLGDERQ